MDKKRQFLAHLFDVAVQAADPYQALRPHFPKTKPQGRTLVVGFGKGSAEMAKAFEKLWLEANFGALNGFVVARTGQAAKLHFLEVLQASHPVPNENSLHAGMRMMREVAELGADDQLVALVSGGGSSLLAAPAAGLALEDKIALNRALLASGAPIRVMNVIRAAASLIKGGRLAALAHPAKVISYIISDVPGDDPALVSSGPTVATPTTKAGALRDLIEYYHIPLTNRLVSFFAALESQEAAASPPASDFSRDEVTLIASARTSLLAACEAARCEGVQAVLLSDSFEGEARDIAYAHGALACEVKRHNQPFTKPVLLLSGGETTVTLSSFSGGVSGSGGRNSEFALALSQTIAGQEGITALIADTDGIDGMGQNAGAFCDGGTLARLRLAGIDPLKSLTAHDSGTAFAKLGDLFTTGPTGINVNDFRALLIE